jgi:hypothetical protein
MKHPRQWMKLVLFSIAWESRGRRARGLRLLGRLIRRREGLT